MSGYRFFLGYWSVILLLVICTGEVPEVSGQIPSFKCTHLTQEDGLSDNMVLCALQDRYGFMWFGTRDGLNRYDGNHFVVYRHDVKDTNSLASISVRCMYESKDGSLWMGAPNGGLDKFDRATQRFIHYRQVDTNHYAINSYISSMCEDSQGYLWCTIFVSNVTLPLMPQTFSTTLQKLNPRTGMFVKYYHKPDDPYSISSNLASYVCKDSNENIWIGTPNGGLNRYLPEQDGFINGRTNSSYSYITTGFVNYVSVGRDKTLWVYDSTTIVSRLVVRNEAIKCQRFKIGEKSDSPGDVIQTILSEENGYVWVGTEKNGLYLVNPYTSVWEHSFYNLIDPNGLSSNRIFALYEDHSGNIWICTDEGINKFHRFSNAFKHFEYNTTASTGLSRGQIRAIHKSADGILLIGTADQGLNEVINRRFHRIPLRDADPRDSRKNTVNIIYKDNGIFLLGTNEGVYSYDPKARIVGTGPYSLAARQVWALVRDEEGQLWIGTIHTGLIVLDQKYNVINKNYCFGIDSYSSVFCFYKDKKSTMWIGSDRGLYSYNTATKQFKHYEHNDRDSLSLSNNQVWYIHEARNGILWIATSGGGLNAFDPQTQHFRHYTEADGLPSNIVCAILEDNHENLWISTSKGLAKFSPASGKIVTFGKSDGLYISEFHFKTCCKDEDGNFYFGGTGGFVQFHPDSIGIDQRPAQLSFTSFKVFDKELQLDTAITLKREIHLQHNDNFFSVEFAALDMSNPRKNLYRYKLEGLEEQWRQTDGRRASATYTNVPPGKYILHLQGSNSDGVWNPVEIVLFIIVEPAWWQTWWFKSVMVVLVVSAIGALAGWRIRSNQQKNRLQRKLIEFQLQSLRAQMNPHFVFNSLNSILHFITSKDTESAHVYLSKFSKLIRSILEQSKTEFISIEEEVRTLKYYLELESLRFDHKFNYAINVDASIDEHQQEVPTMLIQPFVENAIKHGLIHTIEGGRVEISFSEVSDGLICTITDNGIGRKRSSEMKSLSRHGHVSRGMVLTQERVGVLESLHRGKYRVRIDDLDQEHEGHTGTRVEIYLPKFDEENILP